MNTCEKCLKVRLDGEKCGCEIVPVIRVDYPEDGFGVFTYLKGYKYPYKGWADQNIVNHTAILKRSLILTPQKFFKYLPFLFFVKSSVLNSFIEWFSELSLVAYTTGQGQVRFLDENRFCRCCREILRLSKFQSKKYYNFIRGLAMILEFDNAYRYRFQDIIGELNKENLIKNGRKEMLRLVKIAIEREKTIDLNGGNNLKLKFEFLYKVLYLCLYLYPKLYRKLKEILLELKIEEVRFDEGDWYYVSERYDYNYGGLSFEERLSAKVKEDKEWIEENPIKEEKQNFPVIGIIPTEKFFTLSKEEGTKFVKELCDNFLKETYKKSELNV